MLKVFRFENDVLVYDGSKSTEEMLETLSEVYGYEANREEFESESEEVGDHTSIYVRPKRLEYRR